MNEEMIGRIRQNFDLERSDHKIDKVVSLREAIERHIKPGQAIFLGEFANAATREIARQFRDAKADFTIINNSRDYIAALVYCGLVKKLIGVAYMHLYPTAGPNRLIQKAFNEGRLEIESWTSLTLFQRLIAGAMDMECMVTTSLLDSDMAVDNKDFLHEIQSPFEKKQNLALIKALNPDIAVVHGWASDPQGNIILGSPYYMGVSTWGARASKEGVVATVEQIVSTDFMRKHSCLVSVPGHLVRSVSEVPFGAHPQSLNSVGMGVETFRGYKPDVDFIGAYRDTVQDTDRLKGWMEEWVFDCAGQEDYLRKLGDERLDRLTSGIGEEEGRRELPAILKNISFSQDYSRNEMTIVAAARKIEEIVCNKNYISFLLGVGFSSLAGWLAYHQLGKKGFPINLLVGTGVFGYSPQPGNPQIGAVANVETGVMLTDTFQNYGGFVGGLNNRCLSVLGAAQIDKRGNINSTKVDNQFIAGSGGANDAANAQEVLVISRQSPKRYVERVDYITCPGARVKTVVSDMGVFEKLGDEDELTLTRLHFNPELSTMDEKINAVREKCGWDLKVSPDIRETTRPEIEELAMIRCFDPDGLYR